MPGLDRISIRGFRSIASLENFELRRLNILVGANGAGKSNFLEFFALLRAMCGLSLPSLSVSGLANYCAARGGCERILHNGSRTTQVLAASLDIEGTSLSLELLPTGDGGLALARQSPSHAGLQRAQKFVNAADLRDRKGLLYRAVASWQLFCFQEADLAAAARNGSNASETGCLLPDASNLAAFLLHLNKTAPQSYQNIVRSTRLAAPCFDDFDLMEEPGGRVRLFWRARHSDYLLCAQQLSEATLRYLALATALLQPTPPSLMLVDGPELGLHPHALAFLAGMIQSLPPATKIVLTTQSPTLLDFFAPQDVVLVQCQNGASEFRRLRESYANWLEDYGLGELWRKNVLGTIGEESPG